VQVWGDAAQAWDNSSTRHRGGKAGHCELKPVESDEAVAMDGWLTELCAREATSNQSRSSAQEEHDNLLKRTESAMQRALEATQQSVQNTKQDLLKFGELVKTKTDHNRKLKRQ